MDFANIPQLGALMSEHQRIVSGLDNLGKGGRIVAMQIAMAARPPELPEQAPMPTVVVSTDQMEYPPQMVEAIKAALAVRRDAIAAQLTEMGVTGVT